MTNWLPHSQPRKTAGQLKYRNGYGIFAIGELTDLTGLNKKPWRVERLRLFLKFLECWEDNEEWWEAYFYNRWLGTWQVSWNRGNLSLDRCYSLVELRGYCTPEEVINQDWFDDWQEYELWTRGFPSFVSFALFRAELDDGEDWRRQVDWNHYAEEETEELGEFGNETTEEAEENIRAEYLVHWCMLPMWFQDQDWYSPGEWHDNLGWDICKEFDVKG